MFEGVDLNTVMASLESIGFYDVALPFLLVFTIFFAILQKVSLFGNDKNNINVVISLVAAFLFVRTTVLVIIMNTFLPQVSFLAIAMILFLILISIVGGKTDEWKGAPMGIAFVVALIGIVLSFLSSAGYLSQWPEWLQLTKYDLNLFIFIGLVVLFIVIVTGGVPAAGKKSTLDIFKELGEGVKK